jgi:hypothetical protein
MTRRLSFNNYTVESGIPSAGDRGVCIDINGRRYVQFNGQIAGGDRLTMIEYMGRRYVLAPQSGCLYSWSWDGWTYEKYGWGGAPPGQEVTGLMGNIMDVSTGEDIGAEGMPNTTFCSIGRIGWGFNYPTIIYNGSYAKAYKTITDTASSLTIWRNVVKWGSGRCRLCISVDSDLIYEATFMDHVNPGMTGWGEITADFPEERTNFVLEFEVNLGDPIMGGSGYFYSSLGRLRFNG